MPPAKKKDAPTDEPNPKQAPGGRGRRIGAAKDVSGASAENNAVNGVSGNGKGAAGSSNSGGINWNEEHEIPRDVLHAYRTAYRLSTPASFANPMSHVILGHGIGKQSPTMAQRSKNRRVEKEKLAMAVRKHFNAMPASESDVVGEMLYRVKTQDKAFTMKFGPKHK